MFTFQLWKDSTHCSDVFFFYFEQVNGDWVDYVDTTFWKLFYYQPAVTCSMLTIETLEQGAKYVQS